MGNLNWHFYSLLQILKTYVPEDYIFELHAFEPYEMQSRPESKSKYCMNF